MNSETPKICVIVVLRLDVLSYANEIESQTHDELAAQYFQLKRLEKAHRLREETRVEEDRLVEAGYERIVLLENLTYGLYAFVDRPRGKVVYLVVASGGVDIVAADLPSAKAEEDDRSK